MSEILPFGFINNGSLCYLNSILQALITCDTFTDYMVDLKPKNRVTAELINIIIKVNAGQSIVDPSPFFNELLLYVQHKYPKSKFGHGQQDSGEGFIMILDAIDDPIIYSMFMYRYLVKLWCPACDILLSKSTDESCILEVPPIDSLPEKKMSNQYITKSKSAAPDQTCPKCNQRGQCCKTYQLSRVPDILIVSFNKFNGKCLIDYPRNLYFKTIQRTIIKFELVSKIEHYGTMDGGHYVSVSKRYGGIFAANDSSISSGSLDPTADTYILFYEML
jgi:ubiquitin C-terminal hydrolase